MQGQEIYSKFIQMIPNDRYITPEECNHFLRSYNTCNIYGFLTEMTKKTFVDRAQFDRMLQHSIELFDLYENVVNAYDYIYSLGDSLDKFGFAHNVAVGYNEVQTIPFSSNMYNSDMSINEDKKKLVDTNAQSFYDNNPDFRNLVENMRSGVNVLIVDFGLTGKGMLTFDYVLSKFVDNLDNIMFVHFTMHPEEVQRNIALSTMPNNIVQVDLLSFFHSNSEAYGSRCVPRYPPSEWQNELTAVYIEDGVPNYFYCNLNRLFFALKVTKVLGRC